MVAELLDAAPRHRKPLISAFILGVLALQLLAILRLPPPPGLWPFLDYPLYTRVHHEGDAIPRWRVAALFSDGTSAWIDPADLGTHFWFWLEHLARNLEQGDVTGVRSILELYELPDGSRLEALVLEDHPLILARDGVKEGTPARLAMLEFRFVVYALLQGGREIRIPPADLPPSRREALLDGALAGDAGAVLPILAESRAVGAEKLEAVRIERHLFALTRHGVEVGPSETLATLSLFEEQR